MLADGITGAMLAAFIMCLIDGTIAFADGAIICAMGLTLGILIGFGIGAIVGLVSAFLDCREECVGIGVAAPGTEGQGVTEEPAAGMNCEEARRVLAASEAALAGAEAAVYGLKIARHAKTSVHIAVAVAATAAMWNGYLAVAGAILIPIFTIAHDALKMRVVEAGLGGIDPGGLTTRRRQRDNAQKLVNELCRFPLLAAGLRDKRG